MGRILALDIGDRRIGVALSDPGRVIASPHSVYERVGYGPDTRYIRRLCDENGVDLVVCGLPLNMDGSRGGQAEKASAFAEKLREAGLSVEMQDERLTTVSAHEALIEGGMRREQRKGTVDKIAAALILESYLQAQRQARAPRVYRINETRTNDMADDKEKNIPETEEEESELIELTDEDGVTSQFEYLTTIEHEDQLYVVLMLVEEDRDEDDDEGEVVILKIEHDDDADEDIYVSVEDDDVSQKVFDKFVEMMENEDNGEE